VVDGVVELRVPGDLSWRNPVLRFVTEACRLISRGADADPEAQATAFEAEAVSAFGEAFNNVAIHGYDAASPGLVTIRIEWLHDRLVIAMTDDGRTFDPGSVVPPNLDDLPESGMGIYIMKSFMDQVVYQPGPPNRLHLTKLRSSPQSDARRSQPLTSSAELPGDERPALELGQAGGGVRNGGNARSGFRRRAMQPQKQPLLGGGATGPQGRAGDLEAVKPAVARAGRK
jgi:serine/threonine-protein kinase RsbW